MKSEHKKIIHIDMDCFYAAVEMRDDPTLAEKPVAVGGLGNRSVLCTANYVARQYGVRSAMSTSQAYRLCPDLIVLPVNMPKYKAVSKRIQTIFREFTELVEPLALDEAYLDVTDSLHCKGSATFIAQAIREKIFCQENLTASAGIAPNKFLAKIASSWKKPNGLFVIPPKMVNDFVNTLPVEKLHGVGKVTAKKLHNLGFNTCADLQEKSLFELTDHFGKFGKVLYEQSRGIDRRMVEPHRPRKSLSVEHTFEHDLTTTAEYQHALSELYQRLLQRLNSIAEKQMIKNQFVKIKFNDLQLTSIEIKATQLDFACYFELFNQARAKSMKPLRLLGLGVHFTNESRSTVSQQIELF